MLRNILSNTNTRDTSISRFLRAVTEYPDWFSCRIERKMVIFPDRDISPGDARVVFGNSGKLYMQTSSQTDLQHAGCEELESVRQSVHLLPRSVIYFEDFLSPCISHHALLYALCVGLRPEYFSHTWDKTRDVKYSRTRRCINSRTLHLEGRGNPREQVYKKKIKDLSFSWMVSSSIRYDRRSSLVQCV